MSFVTVRLTTECINNGSYRFVAKEDGSSNDIDRRQWVCQIIGLPFLNRRNGRCPPIFKQFRISEEGELERIFYKCWSASKPPLAQVHKYLVYLRKNLKLSNSAFSLSEVGNKTTYFWNFQRP